MSNPFPKHQQKPQKMLTFLDRLHHKYQILSKLTQKQCQLFNNQVILLLVDQNQNVDQQAYGEVAKNIGLDAFVLDILGKCVNRSPFTNQYELKKNISSIADNLQKQVKEVNKKMKIVQRKQAELNQKQLGLKNKLKQHAIQLQKQSMNKLINKQNQIKKNINALLNNVRAKEKIVQDRRQEIMNKLAELVGKQKNIAMREKQLGRKINNPEISNVQMGQIGTQIPNNEACININNRMGVGNGLKQMRQLNKKYQQCKAELEKMKKKYKTTQMAYSKLKNDLANSNKQKQKLQQQILDIKKQLEDNRTKYPQQQKQKQKNPLQPTRQKQKNKPTIQQHTDPTISINNNIRVIHNKVFDKNNENNNKQLIDMLEMLQISHIEVGEDSMMDKYKQNYHTNQQVQKVKDIHKQSYMKTKGSINVVSCNAVKQKQVCGSVGNKQVMVSQGKSSNQQNSGQQIEQEEIARTLGIQPSQSQLYEQQSQQQSEINIPNFLTTDNSNPNSILTQITNILNSTGKQSPTITLIHNNHLLAFVQLPSFHHNKHNLTEYLDTLLTLIQQSNPHYYQLIEHLGRQQFTEFFQLSYLNYETILQITEATTLILSRIMMITTVDIKYRPQFINAIKVRAKAINSHNTQSEQFLQANINCLLSMIHT